MRNWQADRQAGIALTLAGKCQKVSSSFIHTNRPLGGSCMYWLHVAHGRYGGTDNGLMVLKRGGGRKKDLCARDLCLMVTPIFMQ